jgi:AcrR family transcriptional regulator
MEEHRVNPAMTGDRPEGGAPEGPARRRGRKPARAVSAEQITEAAVAIADSEGLEAVSMRRIATELGVPPMTLYGKVASKGDLLSRMADQVIGGVLIAGEMPVTWRGALGEIAIRNYIAFSGHTWIIPVLAERRPLGENAHAAARQAAQALEMLPLPAEETWVVQGALNDYALGFAFRTVGGPTPDELSRAITSPDVEELPDLAALPDTARSRSSPQRFRFGLKLLLDGIEARVAEPLVAAPTMLQSEVLPPSMRSIFSV